MWFIPSPDLNIPGLSSLVASDSVVKLVISLSDLLKTWISGGIEGQLFYDSLLMCIFSGE